MFRLHNCRFYNKEFYSTHPLSPIMLDVEDNRKISNVLFEDVLNFCLATDVCKSLGLSMKELLSMDLASYSTIKQAVIKNNEERSAILAKADRESKENQRKILGGL